LRKKEKNIRPASSCSRSGEREARQTNEKSAGLIING